jgi:membrane protease YdiL (CAAX protease family)
MQEQSTRPISRPRSRRIAEGVAFVVVWVAIGFIFDLGETANRQSIYLVIGIPLTIVFQLFVRRRPLQELWVRNGPKLERRAVFVPLVVVLLVVPVYLFVRDVNDGAGFVLYDLALLVGAVGAGCAVKQFVDATWRDLAQCLLTAGLIGTLAALDIYANVTAAHPFGSPFDAPALRDFFVSLGTYIAAVFVVEEVWFRGALDSHVHLPGESHGVLSAALVSLLWSWWHLPLAAGQGVIKSVFTLPIVMVPMGIFLSIYWRRSGNLAVPGFTHALSDTVRNVLVGVP